MLSDLMSTTERDWHSYNEALVRRGELNLDSSVVEEWRRELKKADEGKVGEPYRYPESYIRLLASVRLLSHQPYRQTEGFVHSLSRFVEGCRPPTTPPSTGGSTACVSTWTSPSSGRTTLSASPSTRRG